MKQLEKLKRKLKQGEVYRRADLEKWSKSVDRHLKELVDAGVLQKLQNGLYYCPKKTVFGVAPAEDKKLVESFLKDKDFLLTSPNSYNALGLGTTQLYNTQVVYNHKRHGLHTLGGRTFDFQLKPKFPRNATEEFLVVDLLNNLDRVAEDQDAVLDRVANKVASFDSKKLLSTARKYGKVRTKKFFENVITNSSSASAR